jgi:hypothetical protein
LGRLDDRQWISTIKESITLVGNEHNHDQREEQHPPGRSDAGKPRLLVNG